MMVATKKLNPSQNHQATSLTGLDKNWLQKVFPVLANWPDEAIAEHKAILMEAADHAWERCRFDRRNPVYTYREPTEKPGEFREATCSECFRKYKTEFKTLMREAGFPKRFLSLTLDQLDSRSKVQEYLENFPALKEQGKGLLIAGNVGTGKTQLIVSLAVELVKRYLVAARFITCFDLLKLFKKALTDSWAASELTELQEAELVIIDDIGSSRLSEFDQAELANFIDKRYQVIRPIVITTNLSKKDLAEFIGERSISRAGPLIMEIMPQKIRLSLICS
ncbi:ATP-binding protein [Desulfofundulus australicus]|nr:ATP-binding protein [Desulfofundulus australicus]